MVGGVCSVPSGRARTTVAAQSPMRPNLSGARHSPKQPRPTLPPRTAPHPCGLSISTSGPKRIDCAGRRWLGRIAPDGGSAMIRSQEREAPSGGGSKTVCFEGEQFPDSKCLVRRGGYCGPGGWLRRWVGDQIACFGTGDSEDWRDFEPPLVSEHCQCSHTRSWKFHGDRIAPGQRYAEQRTDCRRRVPTYWLDDDRSLRPNGHRLADGRVLIVGGGLNVTDGDIQDAHVSAEFYDPASGTFKATGSMHTARGDHTATLLSDGRVLIAGGSNDSGNVAQAEIYDPSTGKFSVTGTMRTARSGATAVLLHDGRVLIAGGFLGGTPPTSLTSAELYAPATGEFSPAGSMSPDR